jgi:hypothetical protein
MHIDDAARFRPASEPAILSSEEVLRTLAKMVALTEMEIRRCLAPALSRDDKAKDKPDGRSNHSRLDRIAPNRCRVTFMCEFGPVGGYPFHVSSQCADIFPESCQIVSHIRHG